MNQNNSILTVKNMVCERCIKAVRTMLLNNKIDFISVELGKIYLSSELTLKNKKTLQKALKKEGFELIESIEQKLVSQIKSLIINSIYNKNKILNDENFSSYLAKNTGYEYSYISRLFSETEGKTIEHYFILQKIERVKELLFYDELTLSQISYELNYSSPQHLSRQFKQITGITPTDYKKLGGRQKLDTI